MGIYGSGKTSQRMGTLLALLHHMGQKEMDTGSKLGERALVQLLCAMRKRLLNAPMIHPLMSLSQMGAGLKKGLRVFRIGPRGSLNAFLFFSSELFSF